MRDEHALVRRPVRVSAKAHAAGHVKAESRVAPHAHRDPLEIFLRIGPGLRRLPGRVSEIESGSTFVVCTLSKTMRYKFGSTQAKLLEGKRIETIISVLQQ